MLVFLLKTLQISEHYGFVQSKFGCCGNRSGYCFVCWNKNVFGEKLDEYHSSHEFCRIVGVQLKFGDREFLVCSTHLPADGTVNKKIGEYVSQELKDYPFPVLIGGDFNVQRNCFSKKCPRNLSGKALTFYNGGYDYNDKPQLEEAKYDWVVGTKHFNLLSLDINPISGEKRWPNKTEGSDHTSIRVKLSMS
jgi:endonuclease/exonuclease/phosphatase family metal-dependent hydrolase